MAGLLITILSGTAAADIRHHPTPLHVDTNDVGVIGDTLIQYGKVEGFAALIIGDVEYEILPHSSFRVPVGALHGTFGSGIREVTAIDSVTGLSVGELFITSRCSANANPNNCEIISAANINTQNYYRCCPFTDFVFPSGVTSIGRGAFYETGLTSLVIPNSVTSIGEYAFGYCENLTTVTWNPSENATIGSHAFAYSGLTSIVIPESVTNIGDGAFSDTRNLRNWQIYPTIDLNDNQFAFCGCDPPADDDYGDDYNDYNDYYNNNSTRRRARREVAASCPTSGPSFVCDCGPCTEKDDSGTDTGLKYGLIAGGVVIVGAVVVVLVYTKFGRSILGLSTSGQSISDSL